MEVIKTLTLCILLVTIRVVSFLQNLKTAFESCGIYKDAVMWLFHAILGNYPMQPCYFVYFLAKRSITEKKVG